ncbi:hypothetical protein RHSIM_Rhsim12G0138600 [Rhododendron simsii]|uniref:Uncharacterized protein n=1 Tax=Rhododendron simsii TaxID=118357 RepID=A0A834G4M5_RHOSS|nr:hypothetical protein RHSIM_Rhsim12G0138600 [Rhododendron simsii]
MASSPSLLRSTTPSFPGQFTAVPTLHSVRLPYGNPRNRWGGLSVEAASVVLVDKTDATKVHRLKTNYLEKIIPLLKEEFSYTNIHQVHLERGFGEGLSPEEMDPTLFAEDAS